MEDFRAATDRDWVTREQAQDLWNDSHHWFLGIIYACRQDPRVIVRNRFWLGLMCSRPVARRIVGEGQVVRRREGPVARLVHEEGRLEDTTASVLYRQKRRLSITRDIQVANSGEITSDQGPSPTAFREAPPAASSPARTRKPARAAAARCTPFL